MLRADDFFQPLEDRRWLKLPRHNGSFSHSIIILHGIIDG
jgi:hypothetical protein